MLTDEQVAEIEELSTRPCYEHVDDLGFVRDGRAALASLLADRDELRAALRKIEDLTHFGPGNTEDLDLLCEEINTIARRSAGKGAK